MLSLTKAILEDAEFSRLVAGIEAGSCPAVLSGLSEIHRSNVIAAIRVITGRPIAVICADEDEALRMAGDIASLTMEDVPVLGAREFTFHSAEVVSRQREQRRMSTLCALRDNRASAVVMTISAGLQRTMSTQQAEDCVFSIETGGEYSLDEIVLQLLHSGYSRCEQVEGTGQFSVRGGILDVFSPAYEEPFRCEFFGDEIDSIGFFDIETQRRNTQTHDVTVIPAAETLPSFYNGEFGVGAEGLAKELEYRMSRLGNNKSVNPQLLKNMAEDIDRLRNLRSFPAADRYIELISPMTTAIDYFSNDTIVVMCEPIKIRERAEGHTKILAEDCLALLETGVLDSGLVRFSEDWDGFIRRVEDFALVMADNFTTGSYPLRPKMLLSMGTKKLSSYGGSLETAASDIAHYIQSDFRVVILCQDTRRAGLLHEYLAQHECSAALEYELSQLPRYGACVITIGMLSSGMEYPALKLAIITEGQLIANNKTNRTFKRSSRYGVKSGSAERLRSFTDLSPGDLVVHDQHGIGRFVGFQVITVDGIKKDYIKIAYAGTDSLYVPATQLDMVAKYIGGGSEIADEETGARGIKLSKLGGTDWTKLKTKAKASAREMARELIQLYAARHRVEGIAFQADTVWQTEFEEKFIYQETDDQLKCTGEIKADMEKPIPMDRLLCGDVGYGKTEIAFRAIMKCIMGGYQAAILVPTTVLAQQHYLTALKRFAGYPVNIVVLSRLRTPAQIKKALREVELGSADLVIGTHRLLQKDIRFRKLGLLVIDEEQRFGVSHKERLKEMTKQVDSLALSATPIPRTLNMALSGIRDMSTIEEPPQSRQPVQTYVMEHDWGILCDAIRREISRGGQVYYLHNRIDNIDRVAFRLSEMLEGVNLAVAHGRMDEEALSDVMERMSDGEIQVLVCTTIIESGIDIPNVNTLIVEDADKLGLSQLHQIRGRVGRSPRRAHAYLTFKRGKVLTEIAEKRLSAIREFAEFNSGFKIAMRDLEIRGAGSLLGSEQSGHMQSVGYDMYLKLLEEAVLEEKGEKPQKRAECPADLNVSAGIPERYIASASQRMDIYRRIALIRDEDDCNEMIGELIDRYGEPPEEVLTLTWIAMLRSEASKAGMSEISQKEGQINFKLTEFDMSHISKLYSMPEYTGRIKVLAGTEPVVTLKIKSRAVVDEALRFVKMYAVRTNTDAQLRQ